MAAPQIPTFAQNIPAPSQVLPPVAPPPTGGGRIMLPQVPAGAKIPEQAKILRFKLLGFSIEGEFSELKAQREELAAPLVGKTVTVADIFAFADQLQQIYVRAGYPLVRVVILPQEFATAARIKLRVIDGYIERMDLDALPPSVRQRVAAVLAPLTGKTHLKQSEMERQLLIAGETAGLILNATFTAGKEVGGSVLVLTGRYRPISTSLYADNSMPAVFGTGQMVATGSLNSLFGLGEQLTASVAGLPDKDITTKYPTRRYLVGSVVLPMGIDGWKLQMGGTNGVTTPRTTLNALSQGLLRQGYVRASYDVLKRRDYELTFNGRFDATNEEVDTLVLMPAVPISIDRLRVLRFGADGIWRWREMGTTFVFSTAYSHGLNGLGARTAADALNSLVPLSRAGADAVFDKWDGHIEVNQALPYDFSATLTANGQTSFHKALLTSEQFDVTGAKMLSGLTAGALPGDTSWALRGELGYNLKLPIANVGVNISPYLFAATGERILWQASVIEIPSVHATNYGTGLRVAVPPVTPDLFDNYAFIEWSRVTGNGRTVIEQSIDGYRLFTGILVRY